MQQLQRAGGPGQPRGQFCVRVDGPTGELEAPPGQDGADPLAAASELDQRLSDRGRIGGDGFELGGLVGQEALELDRDACGDGLRRVELIDHGRAEPGRGFRDGAVSGHGTMFPPMVTTFCALSSESSATVTTRTLSLSLCLKLSTRALLVFTSSPSGS